MVTPMNEDYFIQRPHMNFFNKIYFSDFMKRYNPLHEWRSYHPYYRVRAANWYGRPPHTSWVDGSIDYTYNKYNQSSIGHSLQHENRKNKPFRNRTNGGDKIPSYANKPSVPTYVYQYYPKGCAKEIHKYKKCVKDHNDVALCVDQKINIMEVCPKWVLESLRERKRVLMRATLIDNETYRRAMRVSDYNQNRSLRDLKEDIKGPRNIRSDSYLYDDRYSPVIYPSPDQNTNINMGENIPYTDVLGGNKIDLINKSRTYYYYNSFESLKNAAEAGTEEKLKKQ
jgi:hypothetical protein